MAMMYQGPYLTPFYRKFHTVLHKEFRSTKTWHTLTGGRNGAGKPSIRQIGAMVVHRATLPLARQKLDSLAKTPASRTRPA